MTHIYKATQLLPLMHEQPPNRCPIPGGAAAAGTARTEQEGSMRGVPTPPTTWGTLTSGALRSLPSFPVLRACPNLPGSCDVTGVRHSETADCPHPLPASSRESSFLRESSGASCGKPLRLTCSTYQARGRKNNPSYQDFSPCHLFYPRNASSPRPNAPSHIILAPPLPLPYLSHPTHPSSTAGLPHSMTNSPSHRLHVARKHPPSPYPPLPLPSALFRH